MRAGGVTSLIVLGSSLLQLCQLRADPMDRWHIRSSAFGLNLHDVTYGSSRFVAVGQGGTAIVSSNGVDWNLTATNLSASLHGVAFGSGRFVAVGEAGALFTSPDGIEWNARDSGTSNSLQAVRWLSDRFLATGDAGTLLSSSNGLDWTQYSSGTAHTLRGVTSGDGLFLAVGAGNSNPSSICISSDGMTWTNQAVNASQLYDVSFGHDRFVVLSVRGQVYVSTNGLDWEYVFRTVDSRYLFALTYVHGRFVAVGGLYGGGSQKIATSRDGFAWTLHPVDINHSGTLRGIAYGDSTFVAVGDKGLILQSDSMFRLTVGPVVQGARSWILTGDAGRDYRVQFTTDPAGNSWTDLTNFTSTSDIISVIDPTAANAPMRFYRAASP